MRESVDDLDKGIISVLAENGSTSTAVVAETLGVSSPTVRARLRSLVERGVVRVAGLVDGFELAGLTTALVGLTLLEHDLDQKVEQLAALDQVNWAAVVTGRYDIVVEVVTDEGMAGLYDFLNVSLHEVGGIRTSEMFVIMKARNRWVGLPPGVRRAWRETPDRSGQ